MILSLLFECHLWKEQFIEQSFNYVNPQPGNRPIQVPCHIHLICHLINFTLLKEWETYWEFPKLYLWSDSMKWICNCTCSSSSDFLRSKIFSPLFYIFYHSISDWLSSVTQQYCSATMLKWNCRFKHIIWFSHHWKLF